MGFRDVEDGFTTTLKVGQLLHLLAAIVVIIACIFIHMHCTSSSDALNKGLLGLMTVEILLQGFIVFFLRKWMRDVKTFRTRKNNKLERALA